MVAQDPAAHQARQPDDLDLLRTYRDENDEQAFTELVQRHVDLVYGLAYRSLCDRQLAEDASQRVFTIFARKGKRQTIRHVSSWLYGATQREVKSMIRSESRRQSREREAFERAMLVQATGNHESIEEMSGVVSSALKRLSEKDQQALFLRFYEGQEFREMGVTLGVEERAAQKRVYRAMERLRSDLTKRGITATAAVFSSQLFTAGAIPSPAGLALTLSENALAAAAGTTSLAALLAPLRLPSLYLTGVAALVVSAGALAWSPLNSWLLEPGSFVTSSRGEATSILNGREATTALERLAVDDIEGIYRLAETLRERALNRLIDHLSQPLEEDYLKDLFVRWTRLDSPRNAKAIVELGRRLPDSEEMLVDLLEIPLAEWWRRDAAAVETWVQGLPRMDRGERVAFGAVVRVISFDDPVRAFALVAARAGTGDEHYAVLAKAFARHDFDHTLTWLNQLPELPAATVASNRDARVRFNEEADAPIRRLYGALLPYFFQWDRQATADWVIDSDLVELTNQFVDQWAQLEPRRTAEWVTELPSVEKRSALVAVTARWVENEPEDAMAWMGPYTLEPDAAPSFGCIADVIGADRAMEWAHQLGEGPGKERLLEHACFQLGLTEAPSTLEARLELLPPSAASAAAQGMIVGQGRVRLAQWRREARPALAAALLLGETEVMAALNPPVAAKGILAEPATASRDAALEILLQRTYRRGAGARELAVVWVEGFSSADRRRLWQERLRTVSDQEPTALPSSMAGGFETQTWGEFRERLDLISMFPINSTRETPASKEAK